MGLLALLALNGRSRVTAPAVTHATARAHGSPVASIVAEVHVRPGDFVEVGDPLVTLSDRLIRRELELVDAELERLVAMAQLEQARLREDQQEHQRSLSLALAEVQRDRRRAHALARRRSHLADTARDQLHGISQRVSSGVAPVDELWNAERTFESERAGAEEASVIVNAERALVVELQAIREASGSAPPLAEPSHRLHEATFETLRLRRRALIEDLERLLVRAEVAGRVLSVASAGASVAQDSSVATLIPRRPAEIVAYLSTEHSASAIEAGQLARLSGPCRAEAAVLAVGAAVERAPEQLGTLLRSPVFGTPVYIEVPGECDMSVGQDLSVELSVGEGPF